MNVLFLHQNFPGQFKLLAQEFALRNGYHVVGVARSDRGENIPVVFHYSYSMPTGPQKIVFPPIKNLTDQVRLGRSVSTVLAKIKSEGFEPSVIIAHPGWGETLFLRDIFPRARFIAYLEFFYRAKNTDVDFDPEFPMPKDDAQYIRFRNTSNLFAFSDADCCVTPTAYQASLFPKSIQKELNVLHDGIDAEVAAPRIEEKGYVLPNGSLLTANDTVVTYVSRSLEPYRGFHILMRALPALMRKHPKAQIVIIGRDDVS